MGGGLQCDQCDSPTTRRKNPRAEQNASSLNDRLLKSGVNRPCRRRGEEGKGKEEVHPNKSMHSVALQPTHQHVDDGGEEGGNAEVEHEPLQGEG